MQVTPLGLPEVVEVTPRKFGDSRGFFSETFSTQKLAEAGITVPFVQDNHSYSAAKGVLRGLHFQAPPHAQDKLIRVVKGAIFDVAVDIRKGSPNFGKWCSRVLSEESWNQLFIPKGFAHGFLTIEPDTEVIYKVSDFYAPETEHSIHYADPDIGIDWPLEGEPVLSGKDAEAPSLADSEAVFFFDETRVSL
ncbi:dTDP-4-dehydrorhamnose 3,5-epimerase [Methyloligella sp. 2.7D]|uniref:dTDP-4-dehydrorhamnose 3,5-epimerase n=1 Tax=unclassified Methyloligella TaxID=2625955 RepID=UPI00157BDA2C|nr:dTDP-4-dehydrorhamnose 3,5-epimerase [Methyloligella sp. GL2]QKP78806.1 dTDP-4-dehydrorhamnose 3,5-epimerase [Methyloligella sp. GL2]